MELRLSETRLFCFLDYLLPNSVGRFRWLSDKSFSSKSCFCDKILMCPMLCTRLIAELTSSLRLTYNCSLFYFFQVKTVKVGNISLVATERDIKEFFSFSGDIHYVEMQRLVFWNYMVTILFGKVILE